MNLEHEQHTIDKILQENDYNEYILLSINIIFSLTLIDVNNW